MHPLYPLPRGNEGPGKGEMIAAGHGSVEQGGGIRRAPAAASSRSKSAEFGSLQPFSGSFLSTASSLRHGGPSSVLPLPLGDLHAGRLWLRERMSHRSQGGFVALPTLQDLQA